MYEVAQKPLLKQDLYNNLLHVCMTLYMIYNETTGTVRWETENN